MQVRDTAVAAPPAVDSDPGVPRFSEIMSESRTSVDEGNIFVASDSTSKMGPSPDFGKRRDDCGLADGTSHVADGHRSVVYPGQQPLACDDQACVSTSEHIAIARNLKVAMQGGVEVKSVCIMCSQLFDTLAVSLPVSRRETLTSTGSGQATDGAPVSKCRSRLKFLGGLRLVSGRQGIEKLRPADKIPDAPFPRSRSPQSVRLNLSHKQVHRELAGQLSCLSRPDANMNGERFG